MNTFTYTQEQIAEINRTNLVRAQFQVAKWNKPTRYSNYPYMTLSMYEEGGRKFVQLAFEAYAAGDEMLGDLHASTAERYFMQADIVRGHLS